MYAQLCKFLVEKAPNFEPPDSIACTFKKLLLKKCRDEFENRSQISQEYEKMANNGGLNDAEEDSKYLAKRKMLGNIKFMGELVSGFFPWNQFHEFFLKNSWNCMQGEFAKQLEKLVKSYFGGFWLAAQLSQPIREIDLFLYFTKFLWNKSISWIFFCLRF